MRTIFTFAFTLIVLSSLAQSKIYSFPDSLNNNIILLENVQDSLVCIRAVRGGVQWSVLDKDLQVVQTKRIRTLLSPNILRQQLIAFHDKILYVKQRILNGRFDILIRGSGHPDDSSFTNGRIVHSEPLTTDVNASNFRVLNYYMNTSLNKKYLLLGRSIRSSIISDSVTISLIVLDSSLTVIGKKEIEHTIKINTEGLISINIDDQGKIFLLSGERADTYMLGTELKLLKYDPFTNSTRTSVFKVPTKKLHSYLIDNNDKDQLKLHVSFQRSNLLPDIEGFANITFNKNDLKGNINYRYFTRADQKQLAKILGASKKTVLDGFTWQSFYGDNDMLAASVRYRRMNEMIFTDRGAYFNDRYLYDRDWNFLNARTPFDPILGGLRPGSNGLAAPPVSSRYFDGKNNYRETFILLTKDKEELELYTLHNRSISPALTYPKLLFAQGPRMRFLYNHKHSLAVSDVTKAKELGEGKLIPGTKDMIIDENMGPIYIGDRAYILTLDPKTRRNSILMLQ